MKKVLLFIGSALFALSANAGGLPPIVMSENSWEQGSETMVNSQGFVAITPSMAIEKGFKVVVTFEATTSGADETLSAVIVDTTTKYDDFGGVLSSWNVVSAWESVSVTSGNLVKTIVFNAPSAVAGPVLCLSTPAGTTYNETINFTSLECTVSDPNYRDPNVTIDDVTITLNELNCNWNNDAEVTSYDIPSKTITFKGSSWEGGHGWAWWGTGLDVTQYKSVTVEFEAADCQVKLYVQQLPENGNTSLVEGQDVADAGATSVTVDFNEMFAPFDKEKIGQIVIMRETPGDVVLKAVYLTYETTLDVETVSKSQITNGIVHSERQISIFNVAGKKIAETVNQFDLNNLTSGIYFIQTAEGSMKYYKK